jgi:hypothetical protein
MKKQLIVLSLLSLGLTGAVQASPYPADAEASFDLPALQTYADRYVGASEGIARANPADAEASFDLPALQSYVERHSGMGASPSTWGVSERKVEPHNPFPFGGGYQDD